MIGKINKVIIKGEFFSDPVSWNFKSNSHTERLFLIYGPNGSGKTTFSKSIYEYKNSIDGNMKNFEQVVFLDDNNGEIEINKNNIWSFNDEFIQKNVRLKKEGLDAIVMLGETTGIDQKIKEKQDEIESCEEKIKNTNLSKYNDPDNPNNISRALQLVINTLKNEWALNDRDIKNHSNASAVNESTINKVIDAPKPSEPIAKLKSRYEAKLKLYRSLPKDSIMINNRLNTNLTEVDDKKIIASLSRIINKPLTDELGKRIIDELNANNELVNIETTRKVVNSSKICPICFQTITTEHKNHLIGIINDIYNKEASEHIEELDNIKIDEISRINFTDFAAVIDGIKQNEINIMIDEINEAIRYYNLQIGQKKQNVFIPVIIENKNVNEKIIFLRQLLEEQNTKIEEYNNNVQNIEDIKESLLLINNQIAQLTIKDQYNNYRKLRENKDNDEQFVKKLQEDISTFKEDIITLNNEKKNLNIGLDEINDDLMMIFNSRKKLQLELNNDLYYVKSGGKRVKFNDLSVGEKNIIGLCYFFSLLRNGHSKDDVFNDDLLIILDDPISSFDYNNRYGIFAFLKRMIKAVFKKNEESKIVILTHELETMMLLDKIRADIDYSKKIYKIENKLLVHYDIKDTLYVNMLNDVIDITSKNDIPAENINKTRRILEAFSFFIYRKKLTEFAKDIDIFNLISDDKIRRYLESSIYRFVLNAESHMEERIQAIPETICYDTWTDDEKRQTIKDVCIIIYSLNKLHLKKLLTDDRYSIVECWYNDLKNNL